jgi:hypothetical protein
MSTAPVKTLIDEQLEEISAHNLRDAFRRAERLGYFGAPLEAYKEICHGGSVLQVLRYRVAQQEQRNAQ